MKHEMIVDVPIAITLVSDDDLLNELNRRGQLVKWARKPSPEPNSLGRSFVSPSTDVENWDCRK